MILLILSYGIIHYFQMDPSANSVKGIIPVHIAYTSKYNSGL